MAKIEAALRITLEFNEAFNHQDLLRMRQLTSDDCVYDTFAPAPDGCIFTGIEAISEFWVGFFRQSSNDHNVIEEVFSVGERCVMRWKRSWTNLEGVIVDVRGVEIMRVKQSLICERLSYSKGDV